MEFFWGGCFLMTRVSHWKRSWTGTIKCEQSDDRRDSDSPIVIVHVAEMSKNASQMHHIIFIDHNFSCKDISYMLHVWNIYLHLPYIHAFHVGQQNSVPWNVMEMKLSAQVEGSIDGCESNYPRCLVDEINLQLRQLEVYFSPRFVWNRFCMMPFLDHIKKGRKYRTHAKITFQ